MTASPRIGANAYGGVYRGKYGIGFSAARCGVVEINHLITYFYACSYIVIARFFRVLTVK